MTKNDLILAERRGFAVYKHNPSVPAAHEVSKSRRVRIGDDQKGVVVDGSSGEVLGVGGALFYEWEEVDAQRFVKLYLAGMRQAVGLSKAAMNLFEQVYQQMRDKPGEDQIILSHITSNMTKTTFYRALRELLEKEFLFNSLADGLFFVNIRFIFNGDRLAFIKGYHLKNESQQQLALNLPAHPAP